MTTPQVPTKSMHLTDKDLINALYRHINGLEERIDTQNDELAGRMCGYCDDKMYNQGHPNRRAAFEQALKLISDLADVAEEGDTYPVKVNEARRFLRENNFVSDKVLSDIID